MSDIRADNTKENEELKLLKEEVTQLKGDLAAAKEEAADFRKLFKERINWIDTKFEDATLDLSYFSRKRNALIKAGLKNGWYALV